VTSNCVPASTTLYFWLFRTEATVSLKIIVGLSVPRPMTSCSGRGVCEKYAFAALYSGVVVAKSAATPVMLE
jgi:hypothetical protein